MDNTTIYRTNFVELGEPKRGKVRDIYDLGDSLLLVATDRLSAFDVVLPDPIPGKGFVLSLMSNFWFLMMEEIIENHLITTDVENFPESCQPYKDQLHKRSMLIKKAEPLPVECIVRGYITGSGWKSYQENGTVCSIELPTGLKESEKLPEPLFTPSTKAEQGQHDENISFDDMISLIGSVLAREVKKISLAIYAKATKYAEERGIIIADTKFEFGLIGSQLILIDELLTPDSSRFWPKDTYRPGGSQPSFDKQYVRDHLIKKLGWDKKPPTPNLPQDVISKTSKKYKEALQRLFS